MSIILQNYKIKNVEHQFNFLQYYKNELMTHM
jgi:hypothetical protein